MATYVYRPQAAIDQNGILSATDDGLSGQIFAIDDLTFSTPLTVTDVAGLAKVDIAVSRIGQTETFVIDDRPEVWWVSGGIVSHLFSVAGMVDAVNASALAAASAASDAADARDAAEGAQAGATDWGIITGKPSSFPPAAHSHDTADIAGEDPFDPALLGAGEATTATFLRGDGVWAPTPPGGSGTEIPWSSVSGKPSTFPPAAHGHSSEAISDSSALGRQLLAAADATAARGLLDAARAETGVDPAVGYDIILLIGQSNMVGRGLGIDTVNYDHVDDRVYAFGASGPLANKIVLATDPIAHWDPNGSVGPGLSIGKEYALTRPAGRKVLLVPAAQGGTAFTAGSKRWRVSHTPAHENLYELAIRQGLAALKAAGSNSRIVGFCWHQGEGGDPVTYAADFDAMLDGLRSRLSAPNAWCVLGEMNRAGNAISETKQQTTLVHIDTPRRKTLTAFAYAGNDGGHNPGDTTHFDAPGARALGRSFGQAIRLAKANVLGVAPSAPTRVGAVPGVPGTLRIRWDRPASRFTDFQVQYREVGSLDWLTWAHTASLHYEAIIPSLTPGAVYEMRVAAVNEAGTSPWSATGTGAVSSTTVPVVVPVELNRCYALRKVRASYTGDCIRLRRSSDNALAEIGFGPDGNIDEAAMRAFCGSGDGFVRAWYDQTGLGGLSAIEDAVQPKIVVGGTVLKENGRVVMDFDGVDDYFLSSTAGSLVGSAAGVTSLAVLRDTGSAAAARIWSETNISNQYTMYGLIGSVATWTLESPFRNDTSTGVTPVTSPLDFYGQPGLSVVGMTDNITSATFVSDLRESDPAPRTRPAGAVTPNRFAIGALVRGSTMGGVTNYFKGRMSEVLLWTTPLTQAQRQAAVEHLREVHNMTFAV